VCREAPLPPTSVDKVKFLRYIDRGPRVYGAIGTIVLAVLPTACAERSSVKQSAPPPVNLSGYSVSFREGFRDGCASARGNYQRNDGRFRADAQYAQGWRDAGSICAGR